MSRFLLVLLLSPLLAGCGVLWSVEPRPSTSPATVETREPSAPTRARVFEQETLSPAPSQPAAVTSVPTSGPSEFYASCEAARRAGAAPLHRGQPGYRKALDRDGDGVACED